MKTIEEMVKEIREHRCVYAILFRNAGVSFEFAEEKNQTKENEYGLTVYKYYDTFSDAVREEWENINQLTKEEN